MSVYEQITFVSKNIVFTPIDGQHHPIGSLLIAKSNNGVFPNVFFGGVGTTHCCGAQFFHVEGAIYPSLLRYLLKTYPKSISYFSSPYSLHQKTYHERNGEFIELKTYPYDYIYIWDQLVNCIEILNNEVKEKGVSLSIHKVDNHQFFVITHFDNEESKEIFRKSK